MKILVVGLSENSVVRGVERYTIELVKALSENSNVEITLLCGSWQKFYLELSRESISVKMLGISRSKLMRHLWHYFFMPLYFKEYDIIHIVNTNPILFKFGRPVVTTIHDLAEYYVPEKYGLVQRYYRRFVSYLISRVSTHIITDSNYSKKTIVDKLSLSPEKVSSIYLGSDHFNSVNIRDCNDLEISGEISGKYFLYWGVLERSKGVLEAIKGFLNFKENHDSLDTKLVLVGKMGNAEEDIVNYLCEDSIIYLGHVCDSTLQGLISGAVSILFPSKYEGFGFPPLEGFVYCDNVIASSTTSVGEITKKFAIQVDPESVNEISAALLKTIEAPLKFTEQEKKTILDDFSWQRCAGDTLNLYEKIILSTKK